MLEVSSKEINISILTDRAVASVSNAMNDLSCYKFSLYHSEMLIVFKIYSSLKYRALIYFLLIVRHINSVVMGKAERRKA
jgi:hypothetical protein